MWPGKHYSHPPRQPESVMRWLRMMTAQELREVDRKTRKPIHGVSWQTFFLTHGS